MLSRVRACALCPPHRIVGAVSCFSSVGVSRRILMLDAASRLFHLPVAEKTLFPSERFAAFTFTNYDLDVRVEPEQQRLALRGKLTLRNDSASAQKNISLQVSSTLDWRSIQVSGKPVQFVTQPYTSDIDHTGALSEAIVTLPQAVPPKGTIELDIGYEGTIPLDATRLTRIGVPEELAKHSDWDQIGRSFTGVRGIGYVAWYPIAVEAANLSEGNSVFSATGRWK